MLSGCLKLAIPLGEDYLLLSLKLVLGRHISYGAVKADVVVILNVLRHNAARVLKRKRRAWANAFPLYGAVPPLNLAVALG